MCIISVFIHTYVYAYTHNISVDRINHIGICVRERDQREPSFSKCCFLCSAFSPIYIFSESHVGWIFDCPLLLDFFPKYID